MLYRCKKCKRFSDLEKVSFRKCKACDFTTARCSAKGCGGTEGAMRSLIAHIRWYATLGSGVGRHIHATLEQTTAKLRLLVGGKV